LVTYEIQNKNTINAIFMQTQIQIQLYNISVNYMKTGAPCPISTFAYATLI